MDNKTIQTMYDAFSSIPGFWELDAWTCRATARSPYRARLIEALKVDASSRVLDVACGSGLNFERLQASLGAEGLLVGIDQSRKTLTLADKRIRKRGWKRIRLTETDCAAYRPDETFDVALCTFAIDIIPPWRETIDMMIDAVEPNGRIGFIGFKESSKTGYKMFNFLWRNMGVVFGGIERGRPIRAYLDARCEEILYEEVYGGFYYLLVGVKR